MTDKISVRLDCKDRQAIQASLNEFGCKTVSDFMRVAAAEKLQRYTVNQYVEQAMERLEDRQKKLDAAAAQLLKVNTVTVEKIAQNLSVIASAVAQKVG